MTSLFSRHSRCGWLVAVLACPFATGCGAGDDGGVKTYKVAAPDDKVKPDDKKAGGGDAPPPADTGAAKVRLLGAIIPAGGGSSFFVKFVGPIDKVTAAEKDFDAFLSSIRVPGEGNKPVSWTVPAGWKEAPARQMRVVTLQKEDGSAPDMYISDPFAGGLLSNVNRWRKGDVGIAEVTEAELPESIKEVTLGTLKAHRVDLRGPGGKGGMGGPFMK
ncbi:Uncharacterized protein OS=Pirellula staleyi (strain ATCC 27377 / DSM 6068 / ICPB 4128) GN=Psta_4196 PE=4 SV=1 [Gemmataceae bacterium]|nr:Uncharacterized protein OS=Pirellula staleyi (strain ATCC 27377 / DSM 6068 / ICPB 4128) GN=Psta_4196 PE=4 SV=1 [Gemmataceae bacterium]VTT97269.1 Uncharacterized protein OS=Pirellula staleyi (strain ATCC 27377 / DSM 6068 / ICPB 4128) GN=Psta_4196 PE=4 SV=1 [Gemmataceae bacterium]